MKNQLNEEISNIKNMIRKLNETYNEIDEQMTSQTGNDRIANIASTWQTVQTKNMPTQVIVNPNSSVNGMKWSDYISKYKITRDELTQAKQLIMKMGGKNPIGDTNVSNPQAATTTSIPKDAALKMQNNANAKKIEAFKKLNPGQTGITKK
jgi:hypothetical protein